VKGVVATTHSFQKGALTFAKAKGLALIRYFNKTKFKWELNRSPSASAFSATVADTYEVERALSDPTYETQYFDLHCLSSKRFTNSLCRAQEKVAVEVPFRPGKRCVGSGMQLPTVRQLGITRVTSPFFSSVAKFGSCSDGSFRFWLLGRDHFHLMIGGMSPMFRGPRRKRPGTEDP
jgi:hypothetical protein